MDGLQFEHRCAELLRYRGFHKVTVTKGSGDQGIDILAQKNGLKYGIQCKYYSHVLPPFHPTSKLYQGNLSFHFQKTSRSLTEL